MCLDQNLDLKSQQLNSKINCAFHAALCSFFFLNKWRIKKQIVLHLIDQWHSSLKCSKVISKSYYSILEDELISRILIEWI